MLPKKENVFKFVSVLTNKIFRNSPDVPFKKLTAKQKIVVLEHLSNEL